MTISLDTELVVDAMINGLPTDTTLRERKKEIIKKRSNNEANDEPTPNLQYVH